MRAAQAFLTPIFAQPCLTDEQREQVRADLQALSKPRQPQLNFKVKS